MELDTPQRAVAIAWSRNDCSHHCIHPNVVGKLPRKNARRAQGDHVRPAVVHAVVCNDVKPVFLRVTAIRFAWAVIVTFMMTTSTFHTRAH